MNKIFDDIQAMRAHFGWDKSDTIPFLVDALEAECAELKESLHQSEAAFEKELADVLMYALALCIDKKLDPQTIIKQKIEEVMQREY